MGHLILDISNAVNNFYRQNQRKPQTLILGKYERTLLKEITHSGATKDESIARKVELLGMSLIESDWDSRIEVA